MNTIVSDRKEDLFELEGGRILGKMDIYKPAHGDCSNGGISHTHNEVVIVNIQSDHAPENAVIVIRDKILSGKVDRIRAIPARHRNKWSMFGGCFIYTSNGIVPNSGTPIPLHDRFEA